MRGKVLNKNKKRGVFLLLLILVGLVILWSNRSYAHIYQYIDTGKLHDPHTAEAIVISGTEALADAKSPRTYVALGDSLTAGAGSESVTGTFPYMLAKKMAGVTTSIRLINLSALGATTGNVVHGQLSKAIAAKPVVVTLLIGVNDIHNFVSLDDFTKNYETILLALTTSLPSSSKIMVVSIPYIGSPQLITQPYRWYFMHKTNKFNAAIRDLVAKYHVGYTDLSISQPDFDTNPTLYSRDLFHPSAEGYALWANIIYANFYRFSN